MRPPRTLWVLSELSCGRFKLCRRSSNLIGRSRRTACPLRSCCLFPSGERADDSVWAVSCYFLGSYIVAQRLSIPLQIQPQAFGVLCAIAWAQCLYYSHKWSKTKAGAALLGYCVVFAGFETGSVYALWVSAQIEFADERRVSGTAPMYRSWFMVTSRQSS